MGALVAAVILTGRTLAPLTQLASVLTRVNSARSAYRSINQLMSSDSDNPANRRWLSRKQFEGAIELRGVTFAYEGQDQALLKNVNLQIKAGERVAILGKVGSGKSTVARLMMGLYTPKEGTVLLDGVDIRQIDPSELRKNVGAMLQDVWLFSGTVRDNIAIGMPGASDDQILEAAKIAKADDFIKLHPLGYEMPIRERGEGLSGGQRQAITLARALLGKPTLVLLDEPTSSMDGDTQKAVIQNLAESTKGQTLIVITHRPQIVEIVDRVIVVDNGTIVADGHPSQFSQPASKGQEAKS
jgi:ATP-binding cassette subfamily C protein LapB